MKKIIATAVAITAIPILSPLFVGDFVKTERESVIAELNSQQGISISTTQYESRWFGADVTTQVSMPLEEGMPEITLVVKEKLSFGPVIYANNNWHFGFGHSAVSTDFSSFELGEELTQLLQDKVHLSALMAFDSTVTTFLHTDEISHQVDSNKITAHPASMWFSIKDNTQIAGEFNWAGFEYSSLEGRFVLDDVAMNTQQTVVSGDYLKGTAVLTGQAHINVAEVNVFEGDAKVFAIEKGQLTSDVSLNNDLLALALNYTADQVSASGQYFSQPSLDIVFANIDFMAIQQLNAIMASINNGQQTTEADSEKLLTALSEITEKVLAKEPNIKINDLSVVTEEGKIASELNVNINKDLFDTNNLNAMSLMTALEADAQGKVPTAFLNKFGMSPMVDSFVQQGFLTLKDDTINFDAKYVENQLTLNGKPFQL